MMNLTTSIFFSLFLLLQLNNSDLNNHKELYPTLINQVGEIGLWENRNRPVNIRIDPRPFSGNPTGVEEITFETVNENLVDYFRSVIEAHGAIPADIVEDNICQSTGGLQPPPTSEGRAEIPDHCVEIAPFISIAFSIPQVYSEDASENNEEQKYVVRAIEISNYTLGVFDLVFQKTMDGEWEFISKETKQFVMS